MKKNNNSVFLIHKKKKNKQKKIICILKWNVQTIKKLEKLEFFDLF